MRCGGTLLQLGPQNGRLTGLSRRSWGKATRYGCITLLLAAVWLALRLYNALTYVSPEVRMRWRRAEETLGYYYDDVTPHGGGSRRWRSGYRNPCWAEPWNGSKRLTDNGYLEGAESGSPRWRALYYYERTLQRLRGEGARERFRCLPAFYVDGPPVLRALLAQHDMLAPGLHPEPLRHLVTAPLTRRVTFEDYLDMYGPAAMHIQSMSRCVQARNNPLLLFDGTPGILQAYTDWRGLPWNRGAAEPRLYLADHLKAINPQVKVIFALREPASWVEFCWERHRAAGGRNYTERDMHSAIIRDIANFNECFSAGGTLRECVYGHMTGNCSVLRALHYAHVRTWVESLGWRHVHVLTDRNLHSWVDRGWVLRGIYKFLGVPEPGDYQAKIIGAMRADPPPRPSVTLAQPTRAAVKNFMRPWTYKLGVLLRKTGSFKGWNVL